MRERGVVAIVLALVIIPIVMCMGLAVDFARAYMVRSALQVTVDSAAIAAAAQSSTTAAVLKSVVDSYVASNAPAKGVTLKSSTVTYDPASELLNVRVTAEIATTFLEIAGVTKLNVAVTADAKRPTPPPLEIALVLDTTVSMLEKVGTLTKLKSLQNATTDLVNTVMVNDSVTIGVVPFGMAVRIPTALARDSVTKAVTKPWLWLDPSDEKIIPTNCFFATTGSCSMQWTMKDGILVYQNVCNVAGYTCNYGEDGTKWRQLQWQGCMGSRGADPVLGDLRASNANLANANKQRDYPAIVPSEATPCSRELQPLTSSKAAVLNVINTLFVHGDTFIPQGLLWGWNILTPEEPFTEAKSKTEMQTLGGQKVMVLMTDGVNSLAPYRMNPTRTIDSGVVTTASSAYSTETPLGKYTNGLTSTLCTNIKSDGIILYTVALAVPDADMKARLSACASDPTKAYDVADTPQLTAAFKEIGQQLMKLRLVK